MQKILKIKESPKGIYVIASLFVLNGLINLPRSLDSILFFVVGLILCAVFVIWALGIMRHNIYAWAGAVIVSAMGEWYPGLGTGVRRLLRTGCRFDFGIRLLDLGKDS